MPIPLIASALTQAGLRLLNSLIDRCQELGEVTDSAEYTVAEHWGRAVLEPALLRSAIDRAQDAFSGVADTHRQWLEVLAWLLEHAGETQIAFCENLWRAYLFRSQAAAEALWDTYPEIQRTLTHEIRTYLPRTWGDWILPMQTFMGYVEESLVEAHGDFEDLFTQPTVLDLVEEMAVDTPNIESGPDTPVIFGDRMPFDEAALTAYLTACRDQIGHIDLRGFTRGTHNVLRVSDVYVPLRLVPIAAPDHLTDTMRYRTTAFDDAALREFQAPFGPDDITAREGLSFSTALNRYPLLAVLGECGAGKTMLLRHLVLELSSILLNEHAVGLTLETGPDGEVQAALARPLPVYVDLADFLEVRCGDELLEEYIVRRAIAMTRDEAIGPLLTTMLGAGQCVLLLDGLDQAATDDQHQMLVDAVAEAAADWRAAGNRVVVTSRFEAYDANPLPGEFAACLIQPLDREGINRLMLNWRRTIIRHHRPGLSDDEVMRQAHNDVLAIWGDIARSQRLTALARRPLYLRMLLDVYQPGVTFSAQRVGIYQMVADMLIRRWRLPHNAARPAVLEHEVDAMLGELAYWLHGMRPTGLIYEDELIRILGRIWHEMHPDVGPDGVRQAIGQFIGVLRMHPGVFGEIAPQRYGFIHQGMQEYFAARYLVSSFTQAAARIRRWLHHPRWNDVIAMAVGFMAMRSREDAADLIEAAVLARGPRAIEFGHMSSPFESLLKRDVFCAAQLLGSGVEVRTDVAERVVGPLMDLWLKGGGESLGRFTLLFDSARRHLENLDGTSAGRLAFQIALEHLDAPDETVQAYAVDALTFWPSHAQEAQEALIDCGTQVPLLMRRSIARAMGRLGPLSVEGYAFLMTLTTDVDYEVCALSRRALEVHKPIPYDALSMWIEFLHSDDPVKQRVSLRRLGDIPLSRRVLSDILLLLDDEDETVHRRVIETLSRVDNLPDDVLLALLRFAGAADARSRAVALGAFTRPVELPDIAVEHLIHWANDPDGGVRRAAITALGTCKNEDPAIIEALVERLDDGSDSIRAVAVDALTGKGRDDPDAQHMLIHAVRDPILQVRIALARALAHIPQPGPDVQEVLSTLLRDSEMLVREAALETVGEMEDPGPYVLEQLIDLASDEGHPIRERAVAALARLRNLPDEALITLVDAVYDHVDMLGAEIAACIKAHMPLSQAVLSEIMGRAMTRESPNGGGFSARTRALMVEMLGEALDETSAALQILLEAADAQSMPVRVAALRGLGNARVMTPGVVDTLMKRLGTGPVEVRCAAGVSLAALIRHQPALPLDDEQLLGVARALAQILSDLPPHAAWEPEGQLQNEVLRALSWVVGRGRPGFPRLGSRSQPDDPLLGG